MARSRNSQKGDIEKQASITSGESALLPQNQTPHSVTSTLRHLLPRRGFEWQMADQPQEVPNLKKDFIFRIQDAWHDYCTSFAVHLTFSEELAVIVREAVDLFDTDVDWMEVNPVDLWTRVLELCDETSFARHPRLTPQTIHAFVAYALEAREYHTQYQTPHMGVYGHDDEEDNGHGDGQLAFALDMFIHRFDCNPDCSRRDDYFEIPETARWGR